ncbi:M12 family metallopeptidase [Paeniglutamicibacter sp. NPDC091659]|uniref:M12 family metallopeptidase n=1 Tax=Paeniglutamicibacter sp. NPDC091659 TaxID=3364389 RepID=UPI0037FBFE3E
MLSSKWVNGTILHYWFLDGPAAQQQAVRDAFAEWKALGIGLVFTEVQDRSEAEVRIGFDQADGSWSYVGRDVLGIPATQPTMNFGWDLTTDYGRTTALHEIGHTLGLPHEHQNPFAGIVWDEPKVYDYFSGSPNFWPREQTFSNVLRKLDPTEVEGSTWDPNSVMEYWFPAGLIIQPAQYHSGLEPAGGLSATDKEWILRFYPKLKATNPLLTPFVSVPLSLAPGGQANFSIVPSETRRYELGTFGFADTVVVLFEEVKGKLRHLAANDNSGTDRNAKVQVKLFKDRKYVARVRLGWAGASGQTAIMLW